MRLRSLQLYFLFGTLVRSLQDINPGRQIGDGERASSICSNLESFFHLIDRLNLHVTKRHFAYQNLHRISKELKALPEDATLTDRHASLIRQYMNDICGTVQAELDVMWTFIVTPKRYDSALLLNNVSDLLGPRVYGRLPEIAQYDLTQAGRCLAFELPTATAFHLLRATEAVLRAFYSTLVKRGRIHNNLWGSIIADLRKHKSAKSYSVLLDHLDNIRRSFRNPTQHPDAKHDIDEIQDLWGLCLDAINRMARALPAPPDEVPFEYPIRRHDAAEQGERPPSCIPAAMAAFPFLANIQISHPRMEGEATTSATSRESRSEGEIPPLGEFSSGQIHS